MPLLSPGIADLWLVDPASPESTQAQIELATAILDNMHRRYVVERAKLMLGVDRAANCGPVDLTRNSLIVGVSRLNRASEIPPLIQPMGESLAEFCGDLSAVPMIQRYARLGGRPAPTSLVAAAREVTRYYLGVGVAALLVGYSTRSQRITFQAIAPDTLGLAFNSDDPSEPTTIRHRRYRMVDWQERITADVYDLTDLDRPSFVVEDSPGHVNKDLTRAALGKDFASGWPAAWRDSTGRPVHRIPVIGHPQRVWLTMGACETTINVAIHRTAWGAGSLDAGFPSRHVRGLRLSAASVDSRTGTSSAQSGPEVVHRWVDDDPEKPGTYWQWGPGFDPEAHGRAVRDYETTGLTATGLPVSFESIGGDPNEHEARAIETALRQTYPEVRRLYAQALRIAACQLNRIRPTGYVEQPESYPAVLLREEIAEYEQIAKEQAEAQAAAAASRTEPADESTDDPSSVTDPDPTA